MFPCPLCDRTFATERAWVEHAVGTTKHENVIAYVARLRVLLAEAERAVAIYRELARSG